MITIDYIGGKGRSKFCGFLLRNIWMAHKEERRHKAHYKRISGDIRLQKMKVRGRLKIRCGFFSELTELTLKPLPLPLMS